MAIIKTWNVMLKELHQSYNGSLEGCKQWLSYCKQINFSQDDEGRCLSIWNSATKNKSELIDDGWFYEVVFIEKKNGDLVEVNLIIDNEGVFYKEF